MLIPFKVPCEIIFTTLKPTNQVGWIIVTYKKIGDAPGTLENSSMQYPHFDIAQTTNSLSYKRHSPTNKKLELAQLKMEEFMWHFID